MFPRLMRWWRPSDTDRWPRVAVEWRPPSSAGPWRPWRIDDEPGHRWPVAEVVSATDFENATHIDTGCETTIDTLVGMELVVVSNGNNDSIVLGNHYDMRVTHQAGPDADVIEQCASQARCAEIGQPHLVSQLLSMRPTGQVTYRFYVNLNPVRAGNPLDPVRLGDWVYGPAVVMPRSAHALGQ